MNWTKKFKDAGLNATLLILSLFFLFIAVELVVFKFIFPASDMPELEFTNQIIKYKPNQTGIYRVRNEIACEYRINANGWNSKYQVYQTRKRSGKKRIVIIGDSFIEAFQVPYNRSVAEQLEVRMGEDNVEVYRLGIGGAPLSQYLHMLRNEGIRYEPDLVVINIAQNDFDESYQFSAGVFRSSFLKLEIRENKVLREIQPQRYEKKWFDPLRRSASWRFLAVRYQLRFGLLRDIFFGRGRKHFAGDRGFPTEANDYDILTTEYVLAMSKQICVKHGINLLVLADGWIPKDKQRENIHTEGRGRWNVAVQRAAKKYETHFIDLQSAFARDFAQNGCSLSFDHDPHWNEYGHQLAADQLFAYIQAHQLI